MKQGKLPENVLKRSVFKQLHTKRKDVLLSAGVGEDCAAFTLKEDEVVVLSTDPVIWENSLDGRYAVHANLNDLATSGAEPIGLMLTAMFPQNIEESQIREMVKTIALECEPLQVQILGGHTEITDAVNRPIISVTAVGKAKKGQILSTSGAKPGDDIVITKWIGLEGTAKLAHARREALLSRYPTHLIDEAEAFEQYFSVIPEAATAMKSGVRAMHDVTAGGILGALWELAEASGVGLDITLKKIPIRQETVEICEFFDINPYQLASGGSFLMLTENGEALADALNQKGIQAAVIGQLTDSNDKIIHNGEDMRYIDRPAPDELMKVF